MSVDVPTDQVPIIKGEDINVESQWSMVVAPDGTSTVVSTALKTKKAGFIHVHFRAYKAPDDVIPCRTARWGTGSWTIPPQYAPSAVWVDISASKYSSPMASNTRITMSDTSDILAYDTVKFTASGGTCYAVVTNVATNAYIDLAPSWGMTLPSYAISNLARLRTTGTMTGYNFVAAHVNIIHADCYPQVCEIVERWSYSDPYYT